MLPFMLFCLVVILACDHFGRSNMAVPLLMVIGAFSCFIYLKWQLRRQPVFWRVVAVLAALHLGLIWYVPWTSERVPTAALAGAGSIDLCLMIVLLAAVEVLLKGEPSGKR